MQVSGADAGVAQVQRRRRVSADGRAGDRPPRFARCDGREHCSDLGIRYATPEFTKISGDTEVVEHDPGNIIRLHTAQTAELDKLDFDGAVDRFVKAARERNMRILMIRPFSFSADQPVADFARFIKTIHDDLIKRDVPIGRPHVYTDPDVPQIVFLLLGLLVSGVSFYVATELFDDRRILIGIAGFLGLAPWRGSCGLACTPAAAAIARCR